MSSITISRFRGDTVADEFTVKDSAGAVVDITGFSFLLTVNTLRAPPDATTQLFQLVGVLTDPTNGVVTFTPTAVIADQTPGKYYFDIQMTDTAGAIETLCVGTYIFTQDVTK